MTVEEESIKARLSDMQRAVHRYDNICLDDYIVQPQDELKDGCDD